MDNQPPAPSQHTVKSVARNIGIGVITPVLAATIIYFLGFNRSDSNADFKKKKEATINVWTQFTQNRTILNKIFIQTDQTLSDEVTIENANHQIDLTVDNMDIIKKEPNADSRVYSSIDIITEQIKAYKPIFQSYLDDTRAFNLENHSDSIKDQFANQKMQDLTAQIKALVYRDTLRLNTFYNGLNKDYNVVLPLH